MIKDLEDRIRDAKNDDLTQEVEKLVLEIENLQKQNGEKLKILEDFEKENHILKVNLKVNNEEKLALQERLDELSLEEELILESKSKFLCESCGEGFKIRSELRIHCEDVHRKHFRMSILNEKFASLETKLVQQKLIFMSTLLNLKEKETQRKYVCQCKGVCKIRHNIFNWSKPRSDIIASKFKDLFEKTSEPNQSQCKTGACSLLLARPKTTS